MKGLIVFFGLVLVSATTSAEVYKWVDEQGVIHFEDRPKGSGNGEIAIENKKQEGIDLQEINKRKTQELLDDMEKSRKQKEKEREKKHAEQRKQDEKCIDERNKIRKLEAKMKREHREFSNDRSDSYRRNEAEVADRQKYIDKYCN